MGKVEKLLLVTSNGNVFRATVKLGFGRKIKSVEFSDFEQKQKGRFDPFIYAEKVEDFVGLDMAHITQTLTGVPFLSGYKNDEKIVEVYSLKAANIYNCSFLR